MPCRRISLLLAFFALLLLPCTLRAQDEEWRWTEEIYEPLFPPPVTTAWLRTLGAGWGYGYDSLLTDLSRWRGLPRINASSLGQSVQGRDIWEVTITAPVPLVTRRRVVTIHARTHPNEVQGTHVANAMIAHLLSDDPLMTRLIDSVAFVFIPMINPDGVELQHPRENSRGIDLERNWDKDPMEPEVAAVKARYAQLMSGPAPIEVALNMHSAYLCKRYFVYHVESATSANYAFMQQGFIEGVRRYFPLGIEPWHFNQTWQGGAPTHFPESWFWYNHGDSVLALTYEDMNCSEAGAYDTTAYALLRGIADFLGIDLSATVDGTLASETRLLRRAAPNPFRDRATVSFALAARAHATVRIFNELGAVVATLADGVLNAGWHEVVWESGGTPSGVYYCTLQSGTTVNTLALIKID